MGKDRRGKDRESKGRDRSEQSGSVSDEDRADRKKERSKESGRSRGRNRSRERGRDRSREREHDRTHDRAKDKKDERENKRQSREKDSRRDEKDHSNEFRGHGRKHQQKSRGRSSSVSDEDIAQMKKKSKGVDIDDSHISEGAEVAKTSGDISLSIEETNKLRESLGLKPLQVDDSQETTSATSVTKEVHVPPSNIGNLQAAEKLREKMETMREKRKQHKILSATKTLGDVDDHESTATWVQKLKAIQDEKEKAEKRAQLLAEMDEEFGVGDLIQGTLQQQKEQAYTAEHLKGLTVEHKTEEFVEGKSVVLTLKDAGILEEADDVLLNVNITEAENAVRNVNLKKRKADYDPYEEIDIEEPSLKPSVLKKYDEEIEGVKREKFELGDFGSVDTSEQRESEIMKQRLMAQAFTLKQGPVQIATEYYTRDEMVQFKKPKKKKKVRRLKADDLLGMQVEMDNLGQQDHGTRKRMKSDDHGIVDEDADPLIGSALKRKRLSVKDTSEKSFGAAKVAQIIQKDIEKQNRDDAIGDAIVLDRTTEFCQQVGEKDVSPTVHESMTDPEGLEIHGDTDIQDVLGGWTEVEVNTPKTSRPKEEELYQEAEPDVSSGLSAALQMASKKGFIDTSKQKKDSSSVIHVFSDMHRDRDYERQKERERERDLSHSRSISFPEKKSYNPHINIEYVDDKGRELTPKEAFRYMSHKFHGRGSGKKKTEKRMKKLQEEHFMNKASSVDTPLNTLAMLQSKQKKSQTPYILISGGSQSMLAPDLEKK